MRYDTLMAKKKVLNPFETEAFLALRKEWYGKLKDSGFKDIEHTDWSTGESGNLLNGMTLVDMERGWSAEQQRYYELAVQYRNPVYQRWGKSWQNEAWKLHSDGKSYRQIEVSTGVHRRHVAKYIKEEASRMLAWARKNMEQE